MRNHSGIPIIKRRPELIDVMVGPPIAMFTEEGEPMTATTLLMVDAATSQVEPLAIIPVSMLPPTMKPGDIIKVKFEGQQTINNLVNRLREASAGRKAGKQEEATPPETAMVVAWDTVSVAPSTVEGLVAHNFIAALGETKIPQDAIEALRFLIDSWLDSVEALRVLGVNLSGFAGNPEGFKLLTYNYDGNFKNAAAEALSTKMREFKRLTDGTDKNRPTPPGDDKEAARDKDESREPT